MKTRFHILQGQALTISSYKFSSRREFTFIFSSLRRGDDWSIFKKRSYFLRFYLSLFHYCNKSQFFFIDRVSLADWLTKLTKKINRFQIWVSDFIWVNTMIKTNQLHLNIFTDLLILAYHFSIWFVFCVSPLIKSNLLLLSLFYCGLSGYIHK